MMKELIQKLRGATGAGIMDAKKALEDVGGDYDKAFDLIRERGLVKAEKKAERRATAGLLESYVHNGRVGVLLEINCETDFVASTKEFRELAHELAMQIAAMDPADVDELPVQQYIKDPSIAVGDIIKQAIAKLGENIKVGRFVRYEIN